MELLCNLKLHNFNHVIFIFEKDFLVLITWYYSLIKTLSCNILKFIRRKTFFLLPG